MIVTTILHFSIWRAWNDYHI